MTDTEKLGGRLALLDPQVLSPAQKALIPRQPGGRYFGERNPDPRGRRAAGRPQRAGEGRSTLRTPIFS
jgi:hypothetical protein